MYDTEHHYGFCTLSSVLECFPGKALDHASDAAGVAIVSCHKSGGSPLDSFILGSLRLFQLDIVDVVGCVDGFTLVGDSDQFTLDLMTLISSI